MYCMFRAIVNNRKIMNVTKIYAAVVERDLLAQYFAASIGSLSSVRGVSGIVNGLLAQLRSRLEYAPGDDDDDDEMTGGVNATTSNGGFSVRGLLGNLVSGVATAVGNQFGGLGGSNQARRACIRRVINVSRL